MRYAQCRRNESSWSAITSSAQWLSEVKVRSRHRSPFAAKAPHNSRWHSRRDPSPPRSVRAKSITMWRVYERAEDEEEKKTRARARAPRFSRFFFPTGDSCLSRARFPRGRETLFPLIDRICARGILPLAERCLSIILELHALIGNQSSWPPGGGGEAPQQPGTSRVSRRTRNFFYKEYTFEILARSDTFITSVAKGQRRNFDILVIGGLHVSFPFQINRSFLSEGV